MKVCVKCELQKGLSAFGCSSRNPDGLDRWCKKCRNTENSRYRASSGPAFNAARRRHYAKNAPVLRQQRAKRLDRARPSKKAYDTEYRQRRAQQIKAYKKRWEQARRDDPVFKIKRNLRRRVHHVLRGRVKADKTFALLGCTAAEFKRHLESLFQPGMSWDNYGPSGWHIDHVVECHRFDLSQPEQQRACFHFSNQRPLWAKDNLSRLRAGTA